MKAYKKAIFSLSVLFTLILSLTWITVPLTYYSSDIAEITNIKSSAPLGYTIHIDNNWTATNTTYSWCNGSGTVDFPFIIKDIEIDAANLNGILIGNSTEYFVISNVNVYNAKSILGYAGINLDNVDNGKIRNSDISNNGYHGIILDGCSDIVIDGNTLEDNGRDGIYLSGSTDCEIVSNIIINNIFAGINVDSNSHNTEIHNNTIGNRASSNQNDGIAAYLSDFLKINNNTLDFNTGDGIYLGASDDANISNNVIRNNGEGIMGLVSGNADIIGNYFLDNDGDSIRFSACDTFEIINNTILGSGDDGIEIMRNTDFGDAIGNKIQGSTGYGIKINELSDTNLEFSLNSFISNGINAKDNGTLNSWDKSSKGNYWDNYTGYDSDLDGIGEIPHTIYPNGADNFPLMVSNSSLLYDNDGDGLTDYQELNGSLNPFGSLPTNPHRRDSDGDGFNDGEEIDGSANAFDNNPMDPNDADTDSDGINDYDENTYSTDPNDADTDDDGFNDNIEVNLAHNPLDILNYPKPDILISSLEISNVSLSVEIMNNGTWNAENVVVIIRISSVFLTLYNNTDDHLNLAVGAKKTIFIEFADYADKLVKGDAYVVSVSIDPDDNLDELGEENNFQGNIEFTPIFGLNIVDVRTILIIAGISIAIVTAGIAGIFLVRRKKALKNYNPLQIMVIQKEGSLMLYNYIFKKDTLHDRDSAVLEPKEKSKKKQGSDTKIATLESDNEDKKEGTQTPDDKKVKEVDELLAAGAFSGIQSLLSNILQTEKGLNEISHGDLTIYFNYGEYGLFIFIVNGRSSECLKKLKLFSTTFEDRFGEDMKDFSGEAGIFKGADDFVKLIILE